MNLKEVLELIIKRFDKRNVDFVLSGGLALSTMNIFRFTKDIDFLIYEESKDAVHEIMSDLGYELQDFNFPTAEGINQVLLYPAFRPR